MTTPCQLAVAQISDMLGQGTGQQLVFSDYPADVSENLASYEWLTGPDTPPCGPPPGLFERFHALGGVSAVTACAEVRALLGARGVAWGREAVDRLGCERADNPDRFQAIILGSSLPAISDDGQHALIAWSVTYGPLAGRGMLGYFQPAEGGRWRQANAALLWIS